MKRSIYAGFGALILFLVGIRHRVVARCFANSISQKKTENVVKICFESSAAISILNYSSNAIGNSKKYKELFSKHSNKDVFREC